jgi:hypothetical protein
MQNKALNGALNGVIDEIWDSYDIDHKGVLDK